MGELDATDAEILRLLAADGRRPYSEIAEAVDLSPPAVSDRVDRLREAGVIRRFTVDIDRSALREGVPVLVEVEPEPGALDAIREGLGEADGVEHRFVTAGGRVIVSVRVPDGDVRGFLEGAVALSRVREYEVSLLTDVEWVPRVEGTALALECAECSNTVTAEGETARIDGSVYGFCCPSCRSRFEERYADLKEGAG